MKRSIYFAVVRFVGKVLFALLQRNGVESMNIIEVHPPFSEVLMEFPRQAFFAPKSE
jgi:hypothetical protein